MPATPPQGSVMPQSLGEPTRDDAWFLSHGYLREALAWGNAGFARLQDGQTQAAGEAFHRSDAVMARGIARHVALAREREAAQDLAVDVLTVGLAAAGAVAGASGGSYRPDLVQDFTDQTLRLNQMLKSDLVQRVEDGTAVSSLDQEQWRAVAIADHRMARAIVRVENQTQHTTCTGFFIAPRLVATAAHCFDLGDAIGLRRPAPWDPEAYMVGRDDFVGTDLQVRPADFGDSYETADARARGFDVAFLRTKTASDAWLPVADRLARPGESLAVLGYSGDLNQGFFLRVDQGCRISGVSRYEVIASTCEAYKGASGGPILSLEGGAPRVVAVIGSGRKDLGPRNDRRTMGPSSLRLAQLHAMIRDRDGWREVAGAHDPFR